MTCLLVPCDSLVTCRWRARSTKICTPHSSCTKRRSFILFCNDCSHLPVLAFQHPTLLYSFGLFVCVGPAICCSDQTVCDFGGNLICVVQRNMSYLEQQRLLQYKQQLSLLQERLQKYSTDTTIPPSIVWKHRFEDSDDDGGSFDDGASTISETRTATASVSGDDNGTAIIEDDRTAPSSRSSSRSASTVRLPAGAFEQQTTVVNSEAGAIGGGDTGLSSIINAEVPEMGSPGPEGITTVVHEGSTTTVVGDLRSMDGFDYLEQAEPPRPQYAIEDFPSRSTTTTTRVSRISRSKRSSRSSRDNNRNVTVEQFSGTRRLAQRQRTLSRRQKPKRQGGAGLVVEGRRRNRFEEPGSVFYRPDDIWDSAGINHDQMRRPYLRPQFNVKGDFPVRACVRVCACHACACRLLLGEQHRVHCAVVRCWCDHGGLRVVLVGWLG